MTLRLERWADGDRELLGRLLGDPAMMEHLGGPESPQKLDERQQRYVHRESGMFKVLLDGEAVGSVGFWEREWRDEQVYEIGWSVLPEFQGRGIAGRATALAIKLAAADGRHRWLHAFPSVENAPSNGICRKLGFELLGDIEFEYPKGSLMRCNDWRFDLFPNS